ncbi:MAG: hypothetical protein JW846_02025 [Dehalococcoidia bacterium]|nr:hypothetical protein [Dehalococcoidia bacterium]
MSSNPGKVHILFICRGNLCRSPMGEALLRWRLENDGLAECVVVESAGYHRWEPFSREAHPFARRAVESLCGRDLLANHSAIAWTKEQVERATLILVAEDWMRDDFPADRVLTMREFGGERGDVEDPYGGDYQEFVACAEDIQRLIAAGLPRLMTLCRGDQDDRLSD